MPNVFADELYESLARIATQDDENDNALRTLVDGIGSMFAEMEDLIRGGDYPWQPIFDVENTQRVDVLRWLGQFIGQPIPIGVRSSSIRIGVASSSIRIVNSGWMNAASRT